MMAKEFSARFSRSSVADMIRVLALSSALCAMLAACGTPQEMCIRRGTADLRTVDRLIEEIEGNLARGFRYETEIRVRHRWTWCSPRLIDDDHMAPRLCPDEEEYEIRRPVPIDPAVEERTLANLKARRAVLVGPAARAVEACRRAYPE
jgi:hypothetical protein